MLTNIILKENKAFNKISRSQKSLIIKKLAEAINLISRENKEEFI